MIIRKAGRNAAAGIVAAAMFVSIPAAVSAESAYGVRPTYEPAITELSTAEWSDGIESEAMPALAFLKKGSSGERVMELQRRLAALSYFDAPATGNFGSITEKAVIEFQRRCGLDADGIVGELTLDRLYADDAPRADGSAARPAPKPDNEPDFDEKGDMPDGSVEDMDAVPDFEGILSLNSRGRCVKCAQARLKALGYFSGGADGIYGKNTASAVKAFQIKCGINVSGEVNFETYVRLYDDYAPECDAVPPRPSPTATPAVTPRPTARPTPPVKPDYSGLMKRGSRGSAVKAVQTRLIELGFLLDGDDGIYGRNTVDAVKRFQIDRGIAVTGEVDRLTYAALYGDAGIVEPESTPIPHDPHESGFTALEKGMTGSSVQRLQIRLNELGYLNDRADGIYGKNTANAVMSFQLKVGMAPTGIADHAMQTALYAPDAPRADAARPTATPAPTAAPSPAATQPPVPTPAYECLKVGSKGEAVKKLQSRLAELGYYEGPISGDYDNGTSNAVKSFQKAHSLEVDGTAGAYTQAALYSDDAITRAEAGHTADIESNYPKEVSGNPPKPHIGKSFPWTGLKIRTDF